MYVLGNLAGWVGDKLAIALIFGFLLLWLIRWVLDRTDPNQKKPRISP
jgi:hypothetical protein